MIRPDAVVAGFELVSGLLIWRSVVLLHRQKQVRGVSFWPIVFFALWGWWNVYWYAYINAWWAWWAGWNVVLANTWWAGQIGYYLWRERRGEVWSEGLVWTDRWIAEKGGDKRAR